VSQPSPVRLAYHARILANSQWPGCRCFSMQRCLMLDSKIRKMYVKKDSLLPSPGREDHISGYRIQQP
jgi:hypothetical protein